MAHADTQLREQNRTTSAGQVSSAGTKGVSFGGVLKSEFIKFFSLLSSKILLLVAAVLIIGFDALQAFGLGYSYQASVEGKLPPGAQAPGLSDTTLASVPTAGIQFGMLILGAMAVLLISSEYGTNMIRSSFAAVPKRWPVYLGKAVVVGIVAFIVAEVSMLIGELLGQLILHGYNVDLNLGIHGIVPGMLMAGVVVVGVTWMGMGLAALIRNSAGTIVTLVALLFVLPIVGNFLTLINLDFFKHLPDYFPSNAGGRMVDQFSQEGMMEPWIAGLVFAAWVAVLFIVGWITFKRRDA